MNLPAEVGVMVLPDCILFPRTTVPLYIFEPRYRRMLREALETHRLWAVALQRPGSPHGQPYSVVGVGVIRASVRQPDGTSQVMLEGVTRARVLRYRQLRPYRVAAMEPLNSVGAPAPAQHATLLAAVQRLTAARAAAGAALPAELVELLGGVTDTEWLTDLAGHTLVKNCRARQALLEELAVSRRLTRLVSLLEAETRRWQAGGLWPDVPPEDHVGRN